MTRTESLYNEFISNFPGLKGKVVKYEKNGKNSICVTVDTGKKFIFKSDKNGIELHPA